MSLKITINADEIAATFKEMALEVEQDIKKAVSNLASMTHAKVMELAQNELHSSRKKFNEAVNFEEVTDGIWIVSIDEKGLWVEEGIEPEKDMKPDLLKNNAKLSKSGNKYKVIPFDHGKAPSQLSPTAQSLVTQIKQNLRKENVPFKKIEYNKDGSPKVGKLHSFNFGGDKLGKGNTPAMKGVSIYQTLTKTGNVRRDIMTFRTVSSGPASADKWFHPGAEGKHFLDRAFEWAEKQWTDQILPDILKKWEK